MPEGVERAVAKALAKSPADRFGSAAEFGRALAERADGQPRRRTPRTRRTAPPMPARAATRRRLAAGAAVSASPRRWRSASCSGWACCSAGCRSHGRADESPAGAKRLAVLPFENLGAAEDEYFADGMTDEVRGKLAVAAGLQVIARSSSGQYKKTTKTPQEIGRELGVDYLLTGTVRWEKGAGRRTGCG